MTEMMHTFCIFPSDKGNIFQHIDLVME